MARNLFPLHKSTVCADCVLTYDPHTSNVTHFEPRDDMSLRILSAAPESSSSGFATSLAAILGILARRPTLLVDLATTHSRQEKPSA